MTVGEDEPLKTDRPAPEKSDTDEGEEPKPSEEFRQALEDFERKGSAEIPTRSEVAAGERVQARVVSIGDEQAVVDFGGRSEGVVETRHLRDDSGALKHGVGDVIDLFVIEAEDQTILAPSLRADPKAALGQLRQSHSSGIPVTGRVVGLNAGGLEVDLSGTRGFCPFSQIEAGYCPDPSAYVGRTLDFLITKISGGRGNVVLSHKALLRREQDEKAKQLLASLGPGQELDGTVTQLQPFGAFVDLGGVTGLVHVSEIRHERTGHPKEALAEGQRVRVRVLHVDREKAGRPRIKLSIKAATPDPWADVEQRFPKGLRVQGTVVRMTHFGAFVNLAPGIDGLVHVSEAALHPVGHVKQVFQPNQPIEAEVLSVDAKKRRISLSVREVLAASEATAGQRSPAVGDLVEGYVAGIKPYGLFLDLPAYGHRIRGLAPREELGEKSGADLESEFAIGDRLEVEVLQLKGEKIRLGLPGARPREERGRPRDRRERPRERRGGKERERERRREEAEEPPMTLMAQALRKAMEKDKGS